MNDRALAIAAALISVLEPMASQMSAVDDAAMLGFSTLIRDLSGRSMPSLSLLANGSREPQPYQFTFPRVDRDNMTLRRPFRANTMPPGNARASHPPLDRRTIGLAGRQLAA